MLVLRAPLAPDNLVEIAMTRWPSHEELDVLREYLDIWQSGIDKHAPTPTPTTRSEG